MRLLGAMREHGCVNEASVNLAVRVCTWAATDAPGRLPAQPAAAGIASPLGRPTAELVLDGPQRPFALVLGCADARVPVELVFNQNLGDLFVVRVAGHAVGPAVLASVEYAVAALQVPLIVVLGHSGCGAVQATRSCPWSRTVEEPRCLPPWRSRCPARHHRWWSWRGGRLG